MTQHLFNPKPRHSRVVVCVQCGAVEFITWAYGEYLCDRCTREIAEVQMAEWDEEARALGYKNFDDRAEQMMRESEEQLKE
jgi:hypothetical protein